MSPGASSGAVLQAPSEGIQGYTKRVAMPLLPVPLPGRWCYSAYRRKSQPQPHTQREGRTVRRTLHLLVIALGIAALLVSPVVAAGAKHQGEHSMTGAVTDIDHDTGKLSLNTQVGELDLHFPPPALKDVKEGDQLTVHLGFMKGSAASATPQKKPR
jgi:hypothetical protein